VNGDEVTRAKGAFMLSLDFRSLREGYRNGTITPVDVVEEVYRRIAARGEDHVWLSLVPREQALRRAHALMKAVKFAGESGFFPLHGLPFSVKDNLHVAGMTTSSSCPAYAHTAQITATAITKAIRAGAILIGKTNMDQFATGLVGIRSPGGYCRNSFNPDYIPGGSSSGAGVSVAAGLVSFAYGSDTGGSGRVPAALNNIVGLKPTPGVISVAGFVYASRSIDVCPIFALTVDDACDVFETVRGYDPEDAYSRLDAGSYETCAKLPEAFSFGVPAPEQLEFFGDQSQKREYEAALDRLIAMGGKPVEIDFSSFVELGRMLFDSALLTERLVEIRDLCERNPNALHSATRKVLDNCRKYDVIAVHRDTYRARRLKHVVQSQMMRCDVLALPTTGTIYRIADVEADPIATNTNNGYYTYFANLAELCAISIPASLRPDGLPFGLCLLGLPLQEGSLRALARKFHATSGLKAGATAVPVDSLYS
jgi:allophanate hydrolase